MNAAVDPPMPADTHGAHAADVRRVTWAGLTINLLLAAAKGVAGVLGNSQAVTADAVHSLSDSASDIAILVGWDVWSKPADAAHPHGHRRIETLVTLGIGLALAASAVGLGYHAVATLRDPDPGTPGWIALGAACVSIVIKELLYRWTVAVGKRVRSSAVRANAWHHRSDAVSSIPAALAVGGGLIDPSWRMLDHVGAVIVALLILQAAWHILRPALGQLADEGAPREDIRAIRDIVRATPQVSCTHAIRTRYLGSGLMVDLHIGVDGDLPVREGHEVSERVKERLIADGPDVIDVVVHLEPHDECARVFEECVDCDTELS